MSSRQPVDWTRVDTVLLDMDGTVLDLAYDSYFWKEYLPQCYAEQHGLSLEEADHHLAPVFESTQGTLNWYCLDYWTTALGLDIVTLKREVAEKIGWLEGARDFLAVVRNTGRPLWLVTNAHPKSLSLKLEFTGLDRYLDCLHSSHDFGFAKEDARFWPLFVERQGLTPERTLFVDDNLSVLDAALTFGIGQCVAITRPDSRYSARDIGGERQSVESLAQLTVGLT